MYFKYFCGILNLISRYPRVPRHLGWEPLDYITIQFYLLFFQSGYINLLLKVYDAANLVYMQRNEWLCTFH
jgi:hypothetical protein